MSPLSLDLKQATVQEWWLPTWNLILLNCCRQNGIENVTNKTETTALHEFSVGRWCKDGKKGLKDNDGYRKEVEADNYSGSGGQ